MERIRFEMYRLCRGGNAARTESLGAGSVGRLSSGFYTTGQEVQAKVQESYRSGGISLGERF